MCPTLIVPLSVWMRANDAHREPPSSTRPPMTARTMPSREESDQSSAPNGKTSNGSRSSIASTIFSVEGGQAAAARLYDSGHTALVCGSDVMALGAVRAARDRGLRVPEDVSVVGCYDSPLVEFTDPPLTTVRAPLQAMAQAARNEIAAAAIFG